MTKKEEFSKFDLLLPSKRDIEKRTIFKYFNVQYVATTILFLSIFVALQGYLIEHGTSFSVMNLNKDFYANLSTELFSISITVLVVDKMIRKREADELKRQLVRELKSVENAIALRALEELRARKWAFKGAIRRAHLLRANFKNAYLKNVDLSFSWCRDANFENAIMGKTILKGTILVGANLLNAKGLTSEQLAQSKMLLGATMPNGIRYDGRFNLEGDLAMAKIRGYEMEKPEVAAKFYGVSLNTFISGQNISNNDDVEIDEFQIKDDWLADYLTKGA